MLFRSVLGAGSVVASSGTIVYVEGCGSVVVLGADDLIVVQTDETTMVLPRARAADLKELLSQLDEPS